MCYAGRPLCLQCVIDWRLYGAVLFLQSVCQRHHFVFKLLKYYTCTSRNSSTFAATIRLFFYLAQFAKKQEEVLILSLSDLEDMKARQKLYGLTFRYRVAVSLGSHGSSGFTWCSCSILSTLFVRRTLTDDSNTKDSKHWTQLNWILLTKG